MQRAGRIEADGWITYTEAVPSAPSAPGAVAVRETSMSERPTDQPDDRHEHAASALDALASGTEQEPSDEQEPQAADALAAAPQSSSDDAAAALGAAESDAPAEVADEDAPAFEGAEQIDAPPARQRKAHQARMAAAAHALGFKQFAIAPLFVMGALMLLIGAWTLKKTLLAPADAFVDKRLYVFLICIPVGLLLLWGAVVFLGDIRRHPREQDRSS